MSERDDWNTRYSSEEYIYGTEQNKSLKEQLELLKPGNILFPAEGEGRNAVYASIKGWNTTAFDQSETGREKAMKLAASRNTSINYLISDISNIELEKESFDVIGIIFMHLSPEDKKAGFKKLISFLKPGGKIIMEVFAKDQITRNSGGSKDVNRLYSIEEINLLIKDMKINYLENCLINLDEGKLHEGEASVLRLSATK